MPFLISAAQTRGNRLPATVTPAAVSRNWRRVTECFAASRSDGVGSGSLSGVVSFMGMSSSSSGIIPPQAEELPLEGGKERIFYLEDEGSCCGVPGARTSGTLAPTSICEASRRCRQQLSLRRRRRPWVYRPAFCESCAEDRQE